jgi:hypothetical protein
MSTTIRTRPTEPLRSEHLELLPHIAELGDLGDLVGTIPDDQLLARLSDAHEFLAGHLAPHAAAEEAVLYPAVEAAMRAPGATATMSRDHVDVRRRIDELARELHDRGPVDATRAERLHRLLYGLHAVVTLHFEKEEEIYLEILDAALAPDEAEELFRRLEEAAG